MMIYQSRIFANKIKRFSAQEKEVLDCEIKKILANPAIGEEKKGDLRGIFIHKFSINSVQYLLAYRLVKEDLELIMLGPHENHYRDLKNYLKSK